MTKMTKKKITKREREKLKMMLLSKIRGKGMRSRLASVAYIDEFVLNRKDDKGLD